MLGQQHFLLELCLLVAGGTGTPRERAADPPAHAIVARTLDCFGLHLGSAPGLDQMALSAGASPAHLRRLFHEVLEASPREAMARIRIQQVMALLWDRTLTFEVVAEQCGFGSASAFSRAFKSQFGYNPIEWRRGLGTGT